MIGQVGEDAFGESLYRGLGADGVELAGIRRTAAAGTGVAVILVEDSGQNRIMLAEGANGLLGAKAIDRSAALIQGAAMLIVQLEIPMAAVRRAVAIAHAAGVPVLLNPAPAAALPKGLLAQVDILVPNELEAGLLAGTPVDGAEGALAAARVFRRLGTPRVVVTLGERGVVVADADGERRFPAQAVRAVDTTAAGDTFIGGLAVALVEGLDLDAAVALGQRASAVCVTRPGAQPSIPHRQELRSLP
jgi:ribokinase